MKTYHVVRNKVLFDEESTTSLEERFDNLLFKIGRGPLKLKQKIKHLYQRLVRGFSDEDINLLDQTLAKLIIPRLKHYQKIADGYPASISSRKQWDKYLNRMIKAFEEVLKEDLYVGREYKKRSKIIREGLLPFALYYEHLWS